MQVWLSSCFEAAAMSLFSPALKKAEESLKKEESPDSKEATPPKRLCTLYAKNLAKLPEGDQGLVKDYNRSYIFTCKKHIPFLCFGCRYKLHTNLVV